MIAENRGNARQAEAVSWGKTNNRTGHDSSPYPDRLQALPDTNFFPHSTNLIISLHIASALTLRRGKVI